MFQKWKDLPLELHFVIYYASLLGGIFLLFFGNALQSDGLHPIVWIGYAAIAVGFFWRIAFIRCPSCGSRMLRFRGIPKHCPDCGESLF